MKTRSPGPASSSSAPSWRPTRPSSTLRSAAERAGLGAFVYLVDPTNRPMLRLREVQLHYRDGLVEGRQPLTGRRPAAA